MYGPYFSKEISNNSHLEVLDTHVQSISIIYSYIYIINEGISTHKIDSS